MAKEKEIRWLPNPKLTRKQNNFVKFMVENPKSPATDAAESAYLPKSRDVAKAMAHNLLQVPKIQLELAKYSGAAESTILDVMHYSQDYGREGGKEGAAYAGVALAAAKDILDRVHGKATQRTESLNLAVELNVNLAD